jgi:hypothetical protein
MAALPLPRLETREAHGLRRSLLMAGIVSSLYYAALTVYVPTQWPGYSNMSQAVSELSAVGAPTRSLWVILCVPYTLMMIGFGLGVWLTGAERRRMRVAGASFIANGVLGVFWPPMHLRGVETSLTDTLHLVWTAAWLLLMLAAMGFAAAAMGRRFRSYTAATILAFVVFGVLTSVESVGLAAGLPTPYLGLWERINVGVGLLWVAVLAVVLLVARPLPEVDAAHPVPPAPGGERRERPDSNVVRELGAIAERLEEMASRPHAGSGLSESDSYVLAAAARNIRAIPKALRAGMEEGFMVGRELAHREVELSVRAMGTGRVSTTLARRAWGGGRQGHA